MDIVIYTSAPHDQHRVIVAQLPTTKCFATRSVSSLHPAAGLKSMARDPSILLNLCAATRTSQQNLQPMPQPISHHLTAPHTHTTLKSSASRNVRPTGPQNSHLRPLPTTHFFPKLLNPLARPDPSPVLPTCTTSASSVWPSSPAAPVEPSVSMPGMRSRKEQSTAWKVRDPYPRIPRGR